MGGFSPQQQAAMAAAAAHAAHAAASAGGPPASRGPRASARRVRVKADGVAATTRRLSV